MTVQNLIQSGKELLANSKQLTPSVAKVVNDIRALAHAAGELTADAEADFRLLESRFGSFLVKVKLADLTTAKPDGTPIPPLQPAQKAAPTGATEATDGNKEQSPPADDKPKTEEPPLRQDGPTLEEYVAAGYKAENYPPPGFAAKPSPAAAGAPEAPAAHETPSEAQKPASEPASPAADANLGSLSAPAQA